MKPSFVFFLFLSVLGFFPEAVQAAMETVPTTSGKSIVIDGDIHHFKLRSGVEVAGAPADGTFDEEIYGKSLTATISGLPAGTYTIVIDDAEVYDKNAGQRVMQITSGSTVLADHLDLFTTAGFAKAYQIQGKVTHQDDMMLGPLVITFTAIQDMAKFNAIRILDAQGNTVASIKAKDLIDPNIAASKIPVITDPVIYTDASKPVADRVDDLVRRMSLAEKVAQLGGAAIPRLNVPSYHYWNEGLHGVARAGVATVFPQAIGMASSWNPTLMHQVGDVIATEGRANYNDPAKKWQTSNYYGITFWSPNINIFRDPRWGRGQETYGEDPYLTSRIAIGFITGIQSDNPRYYKALATAKHFAAHSGPETGRDHFNSIPPLRDLYETYLPQFEAAVKEAHVGSVMASYNALYGVPNSANPFLLQDILRDKWGFQGYVVSDCFAVPNIWDKFHYASSEAQGAAYAWKAGLDQECGGSHNGLVLAVQKNWISEDVITTSVKRIMTGRFKLGMFDPPADCPYSTITMADIDSPAHAAINLEMAHQSMVLLKNNGVLPLDTTKIKTIAVIGPNAKSIEVLNGNYNGTISHPVYLFDGIQTAAGSGVQVTYAKGCPLRAASLDVNSKDAKEALQNAQAADVVIYVGGIDGSFENENHDREKIELPEDQAQMLQALQATGKPVVFVNCSGSAVAFPWAAAHVSAILQAWYPGGQGGTAVADVLFGKYNPAGRLPITFYEKTDDLPDLADYSMTNRTYRYFTGKPVYPFGFGLSYTTFQYSPAVPVNPTLAAADTLHFSVPIRNTGAMDGDEVVQVYLHHKNSVVSQPIHSLVAFKRVPISKGATVNVAFDVPVSQFRYWSEVTKDYAIEPGKYDLQIAAASDDIRQTFEVTVTP